jgi:pimeloyl-ACP methyl ester carboxylesterase
LREIDPARVPLQPNSQGVVLLHGIARRARSLKQFERALKAAGFATLNLDYPSRKMKIDLLADHVHPAVSGFAEQNKNVHFVGHSMGGLLARAYIAKYRPVNLGRVVMLGTPNGGSELADRLTHFSLYQSFYGPAGLQLTTKSNHMLESLPEVNYAVGIVSGTLSADPFASLLSLPKPNDGRVSVQNSKLAGMVDHITVRTSHSGLLSHRGVINQTIDFLQHGNFGPFDISHQHCHP